MIPMGLSIWHLFIILMVFVGLLSPLIPIGNILRRAGHSPWLALIALVPLVNWVFLWIFAFTPWPCDGDRA